MIACRINPQDKRKIDVCLTPAGEKALEDYESARVRTLAEILRALSEEDQEEMNRLLDKLHLVIERGSVVAR